MYLCQLDDLNYYCMTSGKHKYMELTVSSLWKKMLAIPLLSKTMYPSETGRTKKLGKDHHSFSYFKHINNKRIRILNKK